MFIAVFVDDVLVASVSDTVVMHVQTMYHKKFRIKEKGLAAEFLNIRIFQCQCRITIDQEQYIRATEFQEFHSALVLQAVLETDILVKVTCFHDHSNITINWHQQIVVVYTSNR